MSEAAFPLLGSLFVFAIVLPAFALVVKVVFLELRRVESARPLHSRTGIRYALLVGSSAVPLAWFLSASLHQAESGTGAEVCAVLHAPGAFCPEAVLFAAALALLAGVRGLPRLLRGQLVWSDDATVTARAARARVDRLLSTSAALRRLRARTYLREGALAPMATVGLLVPRIVVRPSLVEQLDDAALAAALLHEAEHVRGWDPFRYFVVWWALAINPVGHWLLGDELSRWILSRETHCDREAVLHGGSAPALAHALVRAARADALSTAGLCTDGPTALELRIGLLLAYAERAPERCCRSPALRLALVAVGAAVLLPLGTGTYVLDALHLVAEHALLWR